MSRAAWTDLGDGLLVRQSVAFAMNSVVLLDPDHALLVDPGVLPSELDDLAAVVSAVAPAEVTLLFTHAHWDHVLGQPWWPEAATLGHDGLGAALRRDAASILADAREIATAHGEVWERGFTPSPPDRAVAGLHFTRIGPWRVVLRSAPGHCANQLSAHLPDLGVLIAADMLSDIELPMLDGPCAPYIATLEPLLLMAEHGAIETLVPGHGTIAEGRDAVVERLTRDLDYLRRLEAAVAGAAAAGEAGAALRRLERFDYGGAPVEGEFLRQHIDNVSWALTGGPAPPP